MKLKHVTVALAAGLFLAGLGLPELADAGGHGGGGHGGAGPRGFGGGRMGGMPMRTMGPMGMRNMGPMAFRGPGAMRGMNATGAFRSYGAPQGARFHGQSFQAWNSSRPGTAGFGRGYGAGRFTRGTALAGTAFPRSTLSAAGNLNARPLAAAQFRSLAANAPLRQAAFTGPNAFFGNRFTTIGYNPYRWNYWSGRWYGYRWYGPVFWPYWFGDYFSYAFWPSWYYDTFWGYGPDVILWGAFWPYGEFAYDGDGYEGAYAGEIYRPYRRPIAPAAPAAGVDPAPAADTCAGFAPGVNDLPIEQLDQIIDATEDQRTAFTELKAATVKAADILKQSCSSETPLTPVARLDAMQRRLTAMAEANEVVRAPLVHLYGLFSEEQKRRLDGLGRPATKHTRTAPAKDVNVAELCTSQASFTNVPAERIARTIDLTEAQKNELEKLKAASANASDGLRTSCPGAVPDTLDGRLDAAQQRVKALITAVDTVRPAVSEFYASLTDEQKAALSMQPGEKQAANNRG